jgi:IQ domain-containing protein H
MFKYSRAQGGLSYNELEKFGIGKVKGHKNFMPKRILPKAFRDDPFAEPPPIDQSDINEGMFNLINRGIIPRDVDVSPAFERGDPALKHQQSSIFIAPT